MLVVVGVLVVTLQYTRTHIYTRSKLVVVGVLAATLHYTHRYTHTHTHTHTSFSVHKGV
jgi:hypothetical protein